MLNQRPRWPSASWARKTEQAQPEFVSGGELIPFSTEPELPFEVPAELVALPAPPLPLAPAPATVPSAPPLADPEAAFMPPSVSGLPALLAPALPEPDAPPPPPPPAPA